jgi:hypothetical protein
MPALYTSTAKSTCPHLAAHKKSKGGGAMIVDKYRTKEKRPVALRSSGAALAAQVKEFFIFGWVNCQTAQKHVCAQAKVQELSGQGLFKAVAMQHIEPSSLRETLTDRQPERCWSPQRRKDLVSFDAKSLIHLVRLAGIEPTTPWFVAKYSIQLSYSRQASYSSLKNGARRRL